MYFDSSMKKASDKLQLFKLKHSRLDTVSHGVESEKYTCSFQQNFSNRILGREKANHTEAYSTNLCYNMKFF